MASPISGERATERVAVLMTPKEKAHYTDCANQMGLSLGHFFREAGAAFAGDRSVRQMDDAALEAALSQLERSTERTEAVLDQALAEVRAALAADGSVPPQP